MWGNIHMVQFGLTMPKKKKNVCRVQQNRVKSFVCALPVFQHAPFGLYMPESD